MSKYNWFLWLVQSTELFIHGKLNKKCAWSYASEIKKKRRKNGVVFGQIINQLVHVACIYRSDWTSIKIRERYWDMNKLSKCLFCLISHSKIQLPSDGSSLIYTRLYASIIAFVLSSYVLGANVMVIHGGKKFFDLRLDIVEVGYEFVFKFLLREYVLYIPKLSSECKSPDGERDVANDWFTGKIFILRKISSKFYAKEVFNPIETLI